MADIFLFHGGPYKKHLVGRSHETDDGRIRAPLNCAEAQHVVYDPEIPGRDAPNAFGDTLFLQKYADLFKNVQVDDYFYLYLMPGAIRYTSFWVASDVAVAGFKVEFDVVDACDIYTAISCDGDTAEVEPLADPIEHDFECGLGHAIKDAVELANFECKYGIENENNPKWSKFRKPEAFQFVDLSDPVLKNLGAGYLRMKIVELPAELNLDCNACSDFSGWPRIQFGLLGQATCFRPNEILPHCVCHSVICAGCEQPCEEECP